MCRYDSMNANGCELVTGAISTYAADALRPIEQRWKNELEIRKLGRGQAARDALSTLGGGESNEIGHPSSSIDTTYGNLSAGVREPTAISGRLTAPEHGFRSEPHYTVEELDDAEMVLEAR